MPFPVGWKSCLYIVFIGFVNCRSLVEDSIEADMEEDPPVNKSVTVGFVTDRILKLLQPEPP